MPTANSQPPTVAGFLYLWQHEDTPLVHTPGPLLAIGHRATISVPAHLVIAPSVPPPGHRRGGRVPIDRRDFYAASEDIGAVVR